MSTLVQKNRENLILLRIFILLLLIQIKTFGQAYDWVRHDSLVKAGVNQIYGIEFDKADNTFDIVVAEYPTHPSGKFFKSMITWWKILLDIEDESMDDYFYNQLEDCIDLCDNILDKNKKNIDALFFKGGSLGFRGRLLAIREKWFKAALDGKEGLDIVYKAYEANPKNVDIQLGFGIYHYYADVIPQKYPAVKPFLLFFPKGDKAKGIKELENVAINGRYARLESRYFLQTLNFQFEDNSQESRKWGKYLLMDFPNNPSFQRYYGLTYVKDNNYPEAANHFKDILKKCEMNYPGYNKRFKREASYYIAMDYKQKNKIDTALVYFESCEKLSREMDKKGASGFLINSILFLGQLNDVLGNRGKALQFYKEVLEHKDRNNSHAFARKYIEIPYSN